MVDINSCKWWWDDDACNVGHMEQTCRPISYRLYVYEARVHMCLFLLQTFLFHLILINKTCRTYKGEILEPITRRHEPKQGVT